MYTKSTTAGITARNLDRYLQTEEFGEIYFPETSTNIINTDLKDKIEL